MRVIVNNSHAGHVPPHEIDGGAIVPPWEVPGRFEAIRTALELDGGFTFEEPPRIEADAVMALHDADYVAYLRETSEGLARSNVGFVMPSVFPFGPSPRARGTMALRGTYCFDTYTPITAGTWNAALGGTAAALHAAELIARGDDRSIYALTRPPGHHAEKARCGGYSYLNNAALAADRLAKLGRVAVLDLDVHHGNGTQHLFYERSDVLVVSLHGDPAHLFPYFSGYDDETGTGSGLGFNRNFPLPLGTDANLYRPALETAMDMIGRFRPMFLVVSFGTDAHESDPIGTFKLPTEFFAEMGRLVSELKLPTLVVQEGGYNLATMGECVVRFLGAFR